MPMSSCVVSGRPAIRGDGSGGGVEVRRCGKKRFSSNGVSPSFLPYRGEWIEKCRISSINEQKQKKPDVAARFCRPLTFNRRIFGCDFCAVAIVVVNFAEHTTKRASVGVEPSRAELLADTPVSAARLLSCRYK